MENTEVSTSFLSTISGFCLLRPHQCQILTRHRSHQALKKDEFYALLSVADLAVITPLRDGMNTTSMEFVIAQDKTKKSPSVLSEFMGISKNMEEALLVNPWDLGVSSSFSYRSRARSSFLLSLIVSFGPNSNAEH